MFQPFLMKLSCLCLSVCSLLSCAPYKQCDESLRVGDELTFKLTKGPSVQEQINECGAPLPFDVGSVFHLMVEKFIGGDRCDGTTGPVRMDDSDLIRLEGLDRRTNSKYQGRYQLNQQDGCSYYLDLQFRDDSLYYDGSGSIYQTSCPFQRCLGHFKGEWVE